MNLFTNCLGCSWSCLRLSKIHAGRSRQAGMWRSATDGCLGGLTPSGEEAGEYMDKAALTFVSYTARIHSCARSEMLFQLSCFFCGWVFYCKWWPQSLSEGVHEEIHAQILLWEEKGEVKEGRWEQSSSSKLRWWLYAASLRAAGRAWWGPPWRRWKRPMVRGKGRRGLAALLCWGCAKWVAGNRGRCAALIFPVFVTLRRGAMEISGMPKIQHHLLVHGRRWSDEPGKGSHL